VKRKPGKPRAQALHVPVAELAQALAMPESKRSRGDNRHSKPRKETPADYARAIKSAAHTR